MKMASVAGPSVQRGLLGSVVWVVNALLRLFSYEW